MAKSKSKDLIPALIDAKFALHLSQSELAERLGSSARTATRWMAGQSRPADAQLVDLVRLVHPVDATLAEEIAAIAGTNLERLGIVSPPAPVQQAPEPSPSIREVQIEPPAPVAHETLVDGIVCVAAEAMNLPPAVVRPALYAAFRRARVLGLAAEVIEGCLAPRRA